MTHGIAIAEERAAITKQLAFGATKPQKAAA